MMFRWATLTDDPRIMVIGRVALLGQPCSIVRVFPNTPTLYTDSAQVYPPHIGHFSQPIPIFLPNPHPKQSTRSDLVLKKPLFLRYKVGPCTVGQLFEYSVKVHVVEHLLLNMRVGDQVRGFEPECKFALGLFDLV